LSLTLQLHHLLSSRTPLSHPLCIDCTTLLQSLLQKQLEEVQKERDAYIAFERDVAQTSQGSPEELLALEKELAELETEEARAKQELRDGEADLKQAEAEEESLKQEDEELEKSEKE
jgi:beclin 1